MILIDTDHLSVLKYVEHPRCDALNDSIPLAEKSDIVATTIICVEKHMRGWLSRIRAEADPRRQVTWYEQLGGLLDFYGEWQVEPFDLLAADESPDFDLSNASVIISDVAG